MRVARLAFLSAVGVMLVTGVVGGLLRAGVAVPVPGDSAWPGRAVSAHAFLMICGFMGTVIAIERASPSRSGSRSRRRRHPPWRVC